MITKYLYTKVFVNLIGNTPEISVSTEILDNLSSLAAFLGETEVEKIAANARTAKVVGGDGSVEYKSVTMVFMVKDSSVI